MKTVSCWNSNRKSSCVHIIKMVGHGVSVLARCILEVNTQSGDVCNGSSRYSDVKSSSFDGLEAMPTTVTLSSLIKWYLNDHILVDSSRLDLNLKWISTKTTTKQNSHLPWWLAADCLTLVNPLHNSPRQTFLRLEVVLQNRCQLGNTKKTKLSTVPCPSLPLKLGDTPCRVTKCKLRSSRLVSCIWNKSDFSSILKGTA